MNDLSALGLLLLLAGLVGAALARLVARLVDRSRRVRRARHAADGEARARRLLERGGYTIVGAQVVHALAYRCDGREQRAGIRVDFIVRRGAAQYVAEVKTGALVTSLAHGPTRRQLLEYQCAFGTQGVLLVDAEARRILRVEF